MWTFTLTILGRVVSARGFQDIPCSHGCSSEFLRAGKFTTLVCTDISLGLVLETLCFEEHLQHLNWRVLCPSEESPRCTRVGIHDKEIAKETIMTSDDLLVVQCFLSFSSMFSDVFPFCQVLRMLGPRKQPKSIWKRSPLREAGRLSS